MKKINEIPFDFLNTFLPIQSVDVVSWKWLLLQELLLVRNENKTFEIGIKTKVYKKIADITTSEGYLLEWKTVQRFANSDEFKKLINN